MLLIADPYRGRKPNGSYSNHAGRLHRPTPASISRRPPTSPTYTGWAKALEASAPHFAGLIAYNDLACAFWPVPPERTPKPVSAPGAPPIVVVGSTGDPATPVRMGSRAVKQLESAVLVTRQGEGHTGYEFSACVKAAVDTYLLELTVPKRRADLRLARLAAPRLRGPPVSIMAVQPRTADDDEQERGLHDVDPGDDQRHDERQRVADDPAHTGDGRREGEEQQPNATNQAGDVVRPGRQTGQAARQQDHGEPGRSADQRGPDERRWMDDRIERPGSRSEHGRGDDRESAQRKRTEAGDPRAHDRTRRPVIEERPP